MTITDIARLSGVGVSTVSRVINNHPDVKTETREKVLSVIKQYSYVPNNSARILKQSNTKNIGVLVKGVFNPFFSAMLKDISTRVENAGYTMILHHYNNLDDLDTLIGFIKEKRLQGVICLGGNFLEIKDESLEDVEAGVVLLSVSIENTQGYKNFSTISIDNKTAAYEGIAYLIEEGHKNIAIMLGEKSDFGVGKLRYAGYKKALIDHGINIKDDYVLYGEYESKKAYEVAKKFLETHKEVTAIFAISDVMAVGVAKAVVDSGLKIREDISVMGFDGLDIAKYYEPTITTIKQPQNEMSKKSVELLLGLLEGETKHQHITLDVELLKGKSTQRV